MPLAIHPNTLHELYHADETAWLDAMSDLIREGRFEELDTDNLTEFLHSMANRDRREVVSRLTVLIAHLLKCEYQPEKVTSSWRATILHQRQELESLLQSRTLRNHAETEFARAYLRGREQALAETELPETVIPCECPYSLEQILGSE